MTDEEKQKLLDEIRPKGKWDKNEVSDFCSVCGHYKIQGSTRFCGYCGADMRKNP